MKIVIDTEKNVIICPSGFFKEVQKKNNILKEINQPEVTHKDEVKRYFDKAIENELVRPEDAKTRVIRRKAKDN